MAHSTFLKNSNDDLFEGDGRQRNGERKAQRRFYCYYDNNVIITTHSHSLRDGETGRENTREKKEPVSGLKLRSCCMTYFTGKMYVRLVRGASE